MRPHLFEEPITVTLATPLQPGAEIRYTLDGSAPTAASTLYTKPLVFTDTTRLRATAFTAGARRLPGIGGLFRALGADATAAGRFHRRLAAGAQRWVWPQLRRGRLAIPGTRRAPQKDKSNLGQDLKINRMVYQHGMGVHAPCELMYADPARVSSASSRWPGRTKT